MVCNICGSEKRANVWEKDGYRLVRCANCDLLYIENPPTDEQLAAHYSFESGYHTQLAGDAAAIRAREIEAQNNLEVLARHARPGSLLDVGCSTGMFLLAAKRAGWRIHGLEFSAGSARIARDKHGLPVDQGSLESTSYDAGRFDVVTMWDVIEHMPDPAGALRAVHALLPQGGTLAIKTPNADGLYPRASLRVAGLVGYWGHPDPPGHLFQFSVATLRRLLELHGFSIEGVHHERIPVTYSFGSPRSWVRSPKWLAYTATFAPLALVGPVLARGDAIIVVAKKRGA